MYMNTASLHLKIESSVKEQAQRTADELGLTLSATIKALLKQFIRTKQLSVGLNEIPNEYLIRLLKQSDKDIKRGRITSFKNGRDALAYLDREIENEKSKKHTG